MKNIDNDTKKTEQNENKILHPDVGIYVITNAFPDKFKIEELKKHFGYAKRVVVNENVKKNVCGNTISSFSINGDAIYAKIPTKKDKDKMKNFWDNSFISCYELFPPLKQDFKDLKKVKVMRLVLDLHGGLNGQMSLDDKRFFYKCINYIKEFLDERPDVKLYVENLTCHGAKNVGLLDIEKKIEDTFKDMKYQDRIFYAKLKDKKYSMTTFLKDNGAFAHIMVDNNYSEDLTKIKEKHKNKETNPAFEYFYLKDGRFRRYKTIVSKSDFNKNNLDTLQKKHKVQKMIKNLDIIKPIKTSEHSLDKNCFVARSVKLFSDANMNIKQKHKQEDEREKKNKMERINIRKKIAQLNKSIENVKKNKFLSGDSIKNSLESSKQEIQKLTQQILDVNIKKQENVENNIKINTESVENYKITRRNSLEYYK